MRDRLASHDFVVVGRRKLRIADITSIVCYPPTSTASERVVICTVDPNAPIVIPSSEPHYGQAVALYHAIDAVDLAEPEPAPSDAGRGEEIDGPTPGDIVNLFADWEPEDVSVTVSLMIVKDRARGIKVHAGLRNGRGNEFKDGFDICLCAECLAGVDFEARAAFIKEQIERGAASFLAGAEVAESSLTTCPSDS